MTTDPEILQTPSLESPFLTKSYQQCPIEIHDLKNVVDAACTGKWQSIVYDASIVQVWYEDASLTFPLPTAYDTIRIQMMPYKDNNASYLYILQSFEGTETLRVYKLEPVDVHKQRKPKGTSMVIALDDEEESTAWNVFKGEQFHVVIGTSNGRTILFTQSINPLSLSFQVLGQRGSSFLSSFFRKTDSAIQAIAASTDQLASFAENKVVIRQADNMEKILTEYDLKTYIDAPGIRQLEVIAAAGHGKTFFAIIKTVHDNSSRLYFYRYDGATHEAHWLNGIAAPDTVQIAGLIVSQKQVAYAITKPDLNRSTGVYAWDDDQIYETSLEEAPLVGAVVADTKTHGCRFWTVERNLIVIEKVKFREEISGAIGKAPNRLVSHLKQSLDHYRSQKKIILPPSFDEATAAEIEAAIIVVTKDLPAKPLMEQHFDLIDLLQEAGLYRDLSRETRWKLMSIGQEIRVLNALQGNKANFTMGLVSSVLRAAQEEAYTPGGGQDRIVLFESLLFKALSVAKSFREELSRTRYSIADDTPPTSDDDLLVWTSCLRSILQDQIVYWTNKKVETEEEMFEIVVTQALQIDQDIFSSNSSDLNRKNYVITQKMVRKYLRNVVGNDLLAFTLAQHYRDYDGLCEIAREHEKYPDSNRYSVDKLVSELGDAKDIASQLIFPQYTIRWYHGQGLQGHLLSFGQKYCPGDLDKLAPSAGELKSCRWIRALQERDFQGATESLVDSVEKGRVNIGDAKFGLCLAQLSNGVAMKRARLDSSRGLPNSVVQTGVKIEKMRELLDVQDQLFENSPKSSRIESPMVLLKEALDRADNIFVPEDKADLFLMAMLVSVSFESDLEIQKHIQEVWKRAFYSDKKLWSDVSSAKLDLAHAPTQKSITAKSVFVKLGALVAESPKLASQAKYSSLFRNHILKDARNDDYPRYLELVEQAVVQTF